MKLRVALTITGGVSLGTFEAGAVAALISAFRSSCVGVDPLVQVDAIGGTSAGAITGLLASRCLLEGLDPIRVMESGWVDLPSLATLRDRRGRSPLTARGLRAASEELLEVPTGRPGEPSNDHQSVPVRLGLSLTNLRALEYQLARPDGRPPRRALTHVDWTAIELHHGLSTRAFIEPSGGSVLDAVLASAANALGFPPVLIDRRLDRRAYEANGIRNFPDTGAYWYTDGGTVDREPLGRTLDITGILDRDLDDDTRRVQVLIHPDPTASPAGSQWADPTANLRWLDVLGQVQKLQGTQTLYDDLRNLERTNTRLAWLDVFTSSTASVLDELDRDASSALRDALLKVHARIVADQASFHALHVGGGDQSGPGMPSHVGAGAAAEAHVVGERPSPIALRHVDDVADLASLPLTDLFAKVVGTIAGLSNKQAVSLEVISPEPIASASGRSADELLAGAFLGHFGGFLDERLRASDFDLGYASAVAWLRGDALATMGVDDETVGRMVTEAVEAKAAHDATHPGRHPDEPWRHWGGASMATLPWRARLAALGMAAHTTRVAISDLLPRRHRH